MKRRGWKSHTRYINENLWTFDSKKTQKKKKNECRGVERKKTKFWKTLIWILFKIWKTGKSINREESSSDGKNFKDRFQLIERNEIGIEKGSEFWPKNCSFSISQEITSINQKLKLRNFWKLEIFCKNTIQNQFSWYDKHMNDFKSFQKHIFHQWNFLHKKFNFSSSKIWTQSLKRVLNITQCIILDGQIS